MYEDIFPEEVKRKTKRKKARKKINLYPKGQTIAGRTIDKTIDVGSNSKPADPSGYPSHRSKPISKKAKATMKRALDIRKYIKQGEKDKE